MPRGVWQCLGSEDSNSNWYLYALFIPIALLVSAFAALKVAPFGDANLLFSDGNAYHINYVYYCSRILRGEHGAFYSFSKGLGGGLTTTAWSYLLSPFTWIFCFAGYEQIPLAFSLSVILMTGIYGLNMYLLLDNLIGHTRGNLIFSTVYALCGFNVVYNFNMPFFYGGVMMLPLMVLGLKKLLAGKSPLLYCISIAYAIITQLQMGYTLCVMSVLIFVSAMYVFYPKAKGDIKRITIRYLLCSLIAGLLSACLWLPTLLTMLGGRAQETTLNDFVFTENAPLLDIGARLFSGASSPEQIVSGLPAIFAGILTIALVILYFMNAEISRREKVAAGVLICIYVMSFYIRTITSAFHGFTHTNWFPFRYSYAFIFLLLVIAARELTYLDIIPMRDVIRCGLVILVLAILIFSKQYEFVSAGSMVADMVLLLVMGGGFWFYKNYPERATRQSMMLLLLLCTGMQLYMNYYISVRHLLERGWDTSVREFQEDILKKEPLIEAIQASDREFYRLEDEFQRVNTGNDPLLYDYNGVGFGGGQMEHLYVFQDIAKLGVSHYTYAWAWYDKGMAAAMDSLLGLRYVVSDDDLAEQKNYNLLAELFDRKLYENPYALGIAIVSDDDIGDVSITENLNLFSIQNDIWSGITGEDNPLFIPAKNISYEAHNPTDELKMTDSELAAMDDPEELLSSGKKDNELADQAIDEYRAYIKFSFVAERDGPVYFYDEAIGKDDFGTQEDILQYVGTYKKGDEVEGKLYLDYDVSKEIFVTTAKQLRVCYADMEQLGKYSSLLNSRQTQIFKDSDSRLSGTAKMDEGQRLLFTIPYDKGWTLWVDGKKTDIERTLDLFMSAAIPKGEHIFELRFIPWGFKQGVCLSLVAVLGLVVEALMRRRASINETRG